MTRAGIVCLAGAPNAGKSTLLNRILGTRLSIESAKPQTTRAQVLGVHTIGETQIVFTDTPGIHHPRGMMQQAMVGAARRSLRDADVVCWVVAADRGTIGVDDAELPRLAERELVVAINKCDRVDRLSVLPLIAAVTRRAPRAECVPVSALTGEGVAALVSVLASRMPEAPWLFAADELTDRPMRFFVAELVREQIFKQLHQELPYRTAVLVERFEERPRKTTYIAATIYVDAEAARKIVLGKAGARIKSIGKAARTAIEALLERHVFLDLHVRVKEDWQSDRRFLEELGLAQ
jgi:GTP-binding protein Era